MRIAIVTGASSGMGKDFAEALAKENKFEQIWVIARRTNRLEALKEEFGEVIRPTSYLYRRGFIL